jgi:hypothetical protein
VNSIGLHGDVEWPAEGTFDLPKAYKVERVVMGQSSHPDQIPYILAWIEVLSENHPGYKVHKKKQSLPKVTPFH